MTPHNQYIEWFLRGGLFFLASMVALLSCSIINTIKFGEYRLLYSFFVPLLIIACNANTPFRAPLTSVFCFFIIFYYAYALPVPVRALHSRRYSLSILQ